MSDDDDFEDVPPDLPSHPSTSIEAYNDMEDSGELARQRAVVEHAFKIRDPGTIAEILHAARLDRNINLTRARTTELKQMGVILEFDRRPCSITRRRVGVYRWVPPGERIPLPVLNKKGLMILELCSLLESFLDNPEVYVEAQDAEQMRETIAEARRLALPKKQKDLPIGPLPSETFIP